MKSILYQRDGYCPSDGFDEEDDHVTLFLRQISEVQDRSVGIARSALIFAAMPHNGLHDIAGTTVVQTLYAAAALGGQSASPERGGTTPAGADVVLHP